MLNKNIKISVTNITKLAEDYLYSVLNDLPETHPDFDLIDSELNRRAQIFTRTTELQQKQDMDNLIKFHQAQDEIIAIFEGYRGKKTIFLIEKLGGEFVDNYSVCLVTFTIKSFVANANQTSEWILACESSTKAKYARLLYYRIYDHYLRYASQESVEKIRLALGA